MGAAAEALPPLPFSELYASHRARALYTARRILGDTDDAEDVVQEVFSRLFRNPEAAFQGSAAYSTWLHRVMVNSCINWLRGKRRRQKLASDPSVGPSALPSPESQLVGKQMQREFERGLTALTPRQRQIVWLREMRGLAYPEIARLLDIPEGTVKSTLNRGRLALLEQLRVNGAVEPEAGSAGL